MGNKSKRNRSEKFWDRLAKSHDNLSDRGRETYTKSIDITRIYLSPSNVVIDLGCGSGLICNEIAGNVNKVIAIDVSSKVIDIASKKAADLNITNIEFLHTTLDNKQFEMESIDAVLAFNILHLVEDTNLTIRRISKLLKSGGYFISSTACTEEKRVSCLNLLLSIFTKLKILPKIKLPKYAHLEKMLLNNGFEILETKVMSESKLSNRLIVGRKQ